MKALKKQTCGTKLKEVFIKLAKRKKPCMNSPLCPRLEVKKPKVDMVSSFFIQKALSEPFPSRAKLLDFEKLQALLYYSYCLSIVVNRQRLFNEHPFSTNDGVVFVSEYERLKQFGDRNLATKKTIYLRNISPLTAISNDIGSEVFSFLLFIWYAYGKYMGTSLKFLIRSEDQWIFSRLGERIQEKPVGMEFSDLERNKLTKDSRLLITDEAILQHYNYQEYLDFEFKRVESPFSSERARRGSLETNVNPWDPIEKKPFSDEVSKDE
jgi:uncharacterized phage-associated protein